MSKLEPMRAAVPFRFNTRVHLQEMTGLKAKNIEELLFHIKSVPGSVIYHHTHHFLQQHQYLSPEPPNDFAYWVTEALNEINLGEKLTSVNTCEFTTIRALREKIIATIEGHLENPTKPFKEVNPGQEFHFIKSMSFILPTPYTVWTPEEFITILKKVSIHSIYFHMFEAKLRLDKGVNDFSCWFENAFGEKDIARKLEKLDPYTYTMEKLREKIIRLIEDWLGSLSKTAREDAVAVVKRKV